MKPFLRAPSFVTSATTPPARASQRTIPPLSVTTPPRPSYLQTGNFKRSLYPTSTKSN